jgi:hypothetical protein
MQKTRKSFWGTGNEDGVICIFKIIYERERGHCWVEEGQKVEVWLVGRRV